MKSHHEIGSLTTISVGTFLWHNQEPGSLAFVQLEHAETYGLILEVHGSMVRLLTPFGPGWAYESMLGHRK